MAYQHIAVSILLADDPACLLRIACHHGAVHVLGVAFLPEPQPHCIGLQPGSMAKEILCSHVRTVAVEVEAAVEPILPAAVEVQAVWQHCWRLCWPHWPC